LSSPAPSVATIALEGSYKAQWMLSSSKAEKFHASQAQQP
jgi:hypothetical protein